MCYVQRLLTQTMEPGIGILPHQKSKIWEWHAGTVQGRSWKDEEESVSKSQRYIEKAVRRQLMVNECQQGLQKK